MKSVNFNCAKRVLFILKKVLKRIEYILTNLIFMTSPRHLRGTDFCEEKKKNEQQIIVVNLQYVFKLGFHYGLT